MTVVTITAAGTGSITVGGGGANDPPSGVTSIQVECWGCGTAAGASVAQDGGGCGGAYARKNAQAVVNGDVLSWTIAAGRDGSTGSGSGDVTNVLLNGGATVAAAENANDQTASFNSLRQGLAANSTGDATFDGGAPVALQGGGGARGGGGGASSGSPTGAGVTGTAGSGAAGGAGAAGSGADQGGGGTGATAGAGDGAAGSQPGGGGGGGSSTAGSFSGLGAAGQVRFTWTAAPADTLLGQACL